MERLWIGLGALAGLAAVAMAALASHGLGSLAPGQLRSVDAAVQMQGWHALALVACGVWAGRRRGAVVHLAGAAFTLGLLAFCGAVYGAELAGLATGALAPVGGSLLMLGWLLLAMTALRAPRLAPPAIR